jgi:hypothetical protein
MPNNIKITVQYDILFIDLCYSVIALRVVALLNNININVH